VRIYLGNAGPSLVSSFHIVGEIFDDVYGEGGVVANQHNVQTTIIPVGGSAMVEFSVEVPGQYTFVDPLDVPRVQQGCDGTLQVTGRGDEMIYSGRTKEEVYTWNQAHRLLAFSDTPGTELSHEALLARGQVQRRVLGGAIKVTPKVCPTPSAFGQVGLLMADKTRAIGILENGLKGEITVNGKQYHGEMPKLPLATSRSPACSLRAIVASETRRYGNARRCPSTCGEHPQAPDGAARQVAAR